MILMIDNYDSFTYNIVQYMGELGFMPKVFRNDEITINEIKKFSPEKIVISPGPCTPKEAGISVNIIKEFACEIPLFGVCLGHQCIGEAFGGKVVRAERLMHGKISLIYHNSKGIFKDIKNPFDATRYHSLIVERKSLPGCLQVIAETKEKEIMALKHKKYPVWGVQFHPESILTVQGKKIIRNFLKL
ncbi:MAG: aminodeoxychorismate/anthranilate synthase component II [Candidatus Aureabacteria bacterium]|nr:aminodeoxychorismate/anthranilate synthase component II [Candidatus Auribacterota bacterium]MCK5160307.1 aminodeoxychorismate/anthranilate synthase component II [Candidatus Auribacterota bacterium]MCK5654715.1 aminodeoxychorismate/anthranilate synthase component II [Candidatus Auribacterota bacterium]